MKKFLLFFAALASLFFLAGCFSASIVNNSPGPASGINTNQNGTEITFYLPTENPLKYCDGANMDSEGFKKTITKKVSITIPETNLSELELIRKTISLSQKDTSLSFFQAVDNPNYLKLQDNTVYVEPTEGWAGVSIALCSWQPFLEVNLLQIPGVKEVIWVNNLAEWDKLK